MLAGVAVLLVSVIGWTANPASAQALPPDAPVSWIATGDSYSSGEGVNANFGPCAQSTLAYGPLAAVRLKAQKWNIDPLAFTACTGHYVEDEFNQREGSDKKSLWEWGTTEQGAPDKANIITLSFGGNDIGFADFLGACLGIGSRRPSSFSQTIGQPVDQGGDTYCLMPKADLEKRMDNLLDPPSSCTDRRKVGENTGHFDCQLLLENGSHGSIIDFYVDLVNKHLTSDGTLVVVGYPSMFAPVNEWGWYEQVACAGITRGVAQKLFEASEHFDVKLREAVQRANQRLGSKRVRYVSRRQLFRDGSHELCGTGDDWMNGVAITGHPEDNVHYTSSFHPNDKGHSATADAVVGALAAPLCDPTLLYDAAADAGKFRPDDPGYGPGPANAGEPPGVSDVKCAGGWAIGSTSRPVTGHEDSMQLFRWVGWRWKQVADLPMPFGACNLTKAGVPDNLIPRLADITFAQEEGACGGQPSPTSTTTSTAPPPIGVLPPSSVGPWPTKDNDGTPVFFAYLGASIIFPDWTSCDADYCIAGSGGTVHVFRLKNITEIGTVSISVTDPVAALQGLGLDATHATAVVKPGPA